MHKKLLLTLIIITSFCFYSKAQTDNCSGTLVLPVNNTCATTNYNVTSAFTDSMADPSCGASQRDGWATFTTDATTTQVDIIGTSNRRLGIALYSGNCGALTEVACSIPNNANASLTNVAVTASTTYYVRLMRTSNGGGDMTGTICVVNTTSNSNDTCATATTLNCGDTNIMGTTIGASNPANGTGCFMSDYGAWYTFVGDGDQTTITVNPSGGFDAEIAIESGSCGALTNITCEDDPETYTFTTTLGTTYFVYVAYWTTGNTTGDFTISRSCTPPPPPPPNDDCANATTLNCGDTNIAGTTDGASNTPNGTGCGLSDYGVWYTFTGDGDQTTINVNSVGGFDVEIAIESGSCGSFTNITCQDNGDPETYSFNTVIGTQYYVYVAYWVTGGNTTGDFTISRVCTPAIFCQTNPMSTEDSCAVLAGGVGLNGGNPTPVPCGTNPASVDLEADFIDVGDTSDYIVEPIAYNPPIPYNGLANTISLNTDDVWSSLISFPSQFDFCFYETNYTECIVGSNGILTFDTVNNTPGGFNDWQFDAELAGTADALIDNAIYGVFQDTDPSSGGEVGWELTTLPNGCRALVVAYHDVPMFNDNSQLYTGMMVLYEKTNIIEIYVEEKNIVSTWNDGNAIIGIQNVGPTKAAFPCGRNGLDANWTATNEAWRFKPNGGSSIATLQWYADSVFPGNEIGTPNENPITVNPSTTTTYYAEITYSSTCNSTDLTVTDDVVVTIAQNKTWDGSTDSNWYDATNWTPPGVPNAADCVLIPDAATTPNDAIANTNIGPPVPPTTPAYAGTLTIDTDGYLMVDEGTNLVVTNWVNTTNGNGILNIRDSGSLIQINDASVNTGAIHVQRSPKSNQAAVLDSEYVYWSSPVQNTNISSISPGTTAAYIWEWDATINGNGVGDHGDWNNASGNMTLGKGFIIRGLSGTPATIPSTAYPVTNNTTLFSGVPNNGVITKQIFHGGYDVAGDPGYQGNSSAGVLAYNNDDNWNLLGNPYPSAISANAFTNLNSDINGTVYLWPHTSSSDNAVVDSFYDDFVYNYNANDYVEHNNTGSNPPGTNDLYIASGQAFFVLMNHTSGSGSNVTFDNSLRDLTSNYDNDNFYDPFNPDNNRDNEDNDIEKHRIWLDLITSNDIANTLLVGYVEGATNEFDRLFDGYEFAGSSISFYSINEDDKMSIQGRSLPFDELDTVPLGLVIPNNDIYSIAINTIDGLLENEEQNIYLEDTYTNTIHDLKASIYSFTSEAGTFNDRFILRYTYDTLGTDEFEDNSGITILSTNETVEISSTNHPIKDITLYDLLGRTIIDLKDLNTLEHTISDLQLSKSAYIVRVTLQNEVQKIKKIVH